MSQCVYCTKETGTSNLPTLSRQWLNWALAMPINLLIVVHSWIFYPTTHQFITNPGKADAWSVLHTSSEGDKFRPGLGLSEYVYSWIVAASSIGTLLGSALGGLLAMFLPYHISFPIAVVTNVISGFLYAFTVNGAMIFISRLWKGLFIGLALVLLNSYLGESADRFQTLRKQTKGRTLKDAVYIILTFIKAVAHPISLTITSVMAQFSHIDQFRWPGWFQAVSSLVYGVLFVIIFEQPKQCRHEVTENETEQQLIDSSMQHANEHHDQSKWKWKRPTFSIRNFMAYIFIMFTAFNMGSLYVLFDTLLNPILTDQFGFTLADISYFMLVVSIIPFLATIFLVVIKLLKVDNRIVLTLFLGVATVGLYIMSDWQSFGKDPCSLFCDNGTFFNGSLSEAPENSNFTCAHVNQVLTDDSIVSLCKAASSPGHDCYWNPRSRITGKYCADCLPRCTSTQKSLYFVQVCIGMSFVMLSSVVGGTVINVVASDYTPTSYQGSVTGIRYVVSSAGRIATALWSDRLYVVSGKRTRVSMTLHGTILFSNLLFLLVMFKAIAPKKIEVLDKEEEFGLEKLIPKDSNDSP